MSRIPLPATVQDAPAAAQPALEAVHKKLGVVPNMFRLIANSPAALEGYLAMSGALAKGAITPALARQLRHRCEKCRAINRGDDVFDGHQHRPSVGLNVVREQRSGPMHRRREIETGGGL